MMSPAAPHLLSRCNTWWYTFSLRHRGGVLCAVGLLWLMLLAAVPLLQYNNSITAFFPDATPAMQTLARGMDVSPAAHAIRIDLYHADGDTILLAKAAHQICAQLSPTLASPQPAAPKIEPAALYALLPSLFDATMEQRLRTTLRPEDAQRAVQYAQSVLAGPPMPGVIPWVRSDPLQWRTALQNRLPQSSLTPPVHPRYGYPVSADGRHLLLTLLPAQSTQDARFCVQLAEHIESVLRTLPNTVQPTVVSGIQHTVANTRAIDSDVRWIGFCALAGLLLIYAIFVRSWGALWLFLTPIFAISATLGVMGMSVGMLSGLALGFGAAVLGIAEDYAVHSHFALRSTPQKTQVFALLSLPMLQALLLNASGFILLLFSALPAIRQLALFALLSLCVGFILALFILPVCPGFTTPALPQPTKQLCKRQPRLLPVGVAVTTLITVCALLFLSLPFDASPHTMGANARTITEQAQNISRIWQAKPVHFLLIEGTDTADALEKNARALQVLRQQTPDIQAFGAADILVPPSQAEKNMMRWRNFCRENTTQLQASFTAACATVGVEKTLFAPFFSYLQEHTMTPVLQQIQQLGLRTYTDPLLRHFPHESITQSVIVVTGAMPTLPQTIAGQAVLLAPDTLQHALHEVFSNESMYIPYTLLLCALVLYVSFRNLAQMLLAMLPPLCALCIILGSMVLLQQPLTVAGLAALPLVFGLAVDHGIMMTHDLAQGAALGIEKAIVVASLTAFVSMGLLAFASHPALRAMGQVIFVGLVVEMLTSLWLLPKFCTKNS